jgi:hypothetical protein
MTYGTGLYDLSSRYARDRHARGLALSGYDAQARRASSAAMGRASALAGGGNAALGARQGVQAATQAAVPIMNQRAAMEGQLILRDQERLRMEQEAEANRARQMLGGLITGAGQIAGMVVPGLAPAAGAAGALVSGGGAGGAAPLAGMLGPIGGMLGGAQQQQQPAPIAPPRGPVVAPQQISMMGAGPGAATTQRTLGMVDQAIAAPGQGSTGAPPGPPPFPGAVWDGTRWVRGL